MDKIKKYIQCRLERLKKSAVGVPVKYGPQLLHGKISLCEEILRIIDEIPYHHKKSVRRRHQIEGTTVRNGKYELENGAVVIVDTSQCFEGNLQLRTTPSNFYSPSGLRDLAELCNTLADVLTESMEEKFGEQ